MATIKETAMAYEPPQTLNISELDKFSVDIEVTKETGKNKEGEEFSYFVAEIDGKKYRVPNSVLGGIKAILSKFPYTKEVSVLKDGSGMNTKYQVIPLVAQGGV